MINVYKQTYYRYRDVVYKMYARYGKEKQIYQTEHYTVYELINSSYSGNRGRVGSMYNIFVVYNYEFDHRRYKNYDEGGEPKGWIPIYHGLWYTDTMCCITPEVKKAVKREAWAFITQQEHVIATQIYK